MIKRFHHIYFIHAILEFHKVCTEMCSKLKHKLLSSLFDRSRYMSFLKTSRENDNQLRNGYQQHNRCAYEFNGMRTRALDTRGVNDENFASDLNRLVIDNRVQHDAVSIPIQMLLFPFVIQPKISVDNRFSESECLSDRQDAHNLRRQYVTLIPANSHLVPTMSHAQINHNLGEPNRSSKWSLNELQNSTSHSNGASFRTGCRLTLRNPLISQHSVVTRNHY